MRHTTYYVQFLDPQEDSGRWHAIARVDGRALAEEIAPGARLLRADDGHHALHRPDGLPLGARKEGTRHHADSELGAGRYRAYGEVLREKAERNLRASPASF
ncbi:MAG TPA: hypothetical protein VK915_10210 [Gaiellaceae bacterium]|nr:hypothetical protein [Gaiellaceae bacterium]